MPLDAPPPSRAPAPPSPAGPPPAGDLGPEPAPVSNAEALGGLAGMGTQGNNIMGSLRMAGELILRAAQMAQMMGDQATTMQLAQVLDQITNLAAQQLHGPMAPPMAGNGLGAPPEGPPAAANPALASPQRALPPMVGV